MQEHYSVPASIIFSTGITPACAGTFLIKSKEQANWEDHPCVCRNISIIRNAVDLILGSPLRVQEHFYFCCYVFPSWGITPACAGTLMGKDSQGLLFRDHPCVCRNIIIFQNTTASLLGSPLRVQEHSYLAEGPGAYWGITPACAGTFKEYASSWIFIRDHPCVCRNIP